MSAVKRAIDANRELRRVARAHCGAQLDAGSSARGELRADAGCSSNWFESAFSAETHVSARDARHGR
jgi:hypothetical protein